MSDAVNHLLQVVLPETVRVKVIELTQGEFTLVDEIDHAWLMQWDWCVTNTGYAARGENRDGRNHLILMHREIIGRMGVELPSDWFGDHINRERLDNRRSNLLVATPRQSSYNVAKTNRHGYRGVIYTPFCYKEQKQYKRKNPWQAWIRIEGRKRHLSLGYYATPEEAARAYDEAARVYHSEFAMLNFPREVQR